MERRDKPASTDQAHSGAILVLGMLLVLTAMLPVLIQVLTTPAHTATPQEAYERMVQRASDFLTSYEGSCCPTDPTSPGALHEMLFRAMAGNRSHYDRAANLTFPVATETFTVVQWATNQHGNAHTTTVAKDRSPTGQAAGTSKFYQTPAAGPAHVIPVLENTSGKLPLDVHYIPLDRLYPYRVDELGRERTSLQVTIAYKRTLAVEDDLQAPLHQARYHQIVGPEAPATELYFAEPDWEDALTNADEVTFETPRSFTMALTDEALAAERALQNAECLEDPLAPNCVDTEGEPFPQHPFQLNATFHQQLAVDVASGASPSQENRTDLYKLTITIPNDWTDVEVDQFDQDENNKTGWTNWSITATPRHHVLTAYHTTPVKHQASGGPHDGPHYVLDAPDPIQAPFRFHARPPDSANQTNLGFHQLEATLESVTWQTRQHATLAVELASSPGRVHRTTPAIVPATVPPTPSAGGTPQGVTLPLGAVLLNGGEQTEVEWIEFRADQPGFFVPTTNPDGTLNIDQVWSSVGEAHADDWSVEEDGRVLVWEPSLPVTCPELSVCGAAASLRLDGANLTRGPPLPRTHNVALYYPINANTYGRWFVRTAKAFEPAPATAWAPFGLAMDRVGSGPGLVPSGFLSSLEASTEPGCESVDKGRNRGFGTEDGYVFDPEDGYPRVGTLEECATPEDPLAQEAVEEHTYGLVVQTGSNEQGGQGVRSVGHARYKTVRGLGLDTLTAWRNGVAEAGVYGNDQARAGGWLNVTVDTRSLADELLATGVGNATLKWRIVDPFNAWERLAWEEAVVVRNGSIEVPEEEVEEAGCSVEIDWGSRDPCVTWDCSDLPAVEKGAGETCEGFPRWYGLNVTVPSDTPLGTHAFVASISWTYDLGTGTGTVEQTAHLVHALDVVTPNGEMARPVLVGQVAWLEDWG